MHLTRDEIQYGSTSVIDAERTRGSPEAGALEMFQQCMDSRRPSGRSPTDGVPDPHARAQVATQGDLVGLPTGVVVRHA